MKENSEEEDNKRIEKAKKLVEKKKEKDPLYSEKVRTGEKNGMFGKSNPKAGRPKGTVAPKKKLNDEITDVLESNFKLQISKALKSKDLSEKDKMTLLRDLLPYVTPKKMEDKKETPEALRLVKIYIKGYNPDDDINDEEKRRSK